MSEFLNNDENVQNEPEETQINEAVDHLEQFTEPEIVAPAPVIPQQQPPMP